MRLDCDQSDPSALSRRPLAHGEGFLGGSWAESVANNAEIAQSVVWLPVHMGNVGIGVSLGKTGTYALPAKMQERGYRLSFMLTV